MTKRVECPWCAGDGRDPCEECDGGTDVQTGEQCNECDGLGEFDCCECGGLGYVEERS